MGLKNSRTRWGITAKTFHWIMAIAIIGNGICGLLMVRMTPSMAMINVFALHKSIGLTVIALWLLRVAWRMQDRAPREEAGPRWQHVAAHITHGLLYVLVLAIPISGWWYNSVRGFPLQWFKQFNLPAIASANPGLSNVAHNIHETLFWILIAVVVVHIGAALKHHFVDRDSVLLRMLPFGRVRQSRLYKGEEK